MSEPIHLFNEKLVDAVSMGATITSSPLNVQQAVSFCVQAIWSAGTTPIGTFDLQASNDGLTFTSVLSAPATVENNSDSLIINVEKHAYAQIRVVYTRTSGSGTLNVYVNGKRG